MLLRNSGPAATVDLIARVAAAAEAIGLDDLWVLDHVAIPPDDAEGSGGRYLDALATLAFVAGLTQRVGIGTAVLVVPYRPPLATAKWVASIQELSRGRLSLGVGVGWMAAEFVACGVPRAQRARITDDTLAFLHRCFASDVVEANGQPFIFSPRPARPPILIGGSGPHAIARAVRHGDGWMPMEGDPDKLRQPIAAFKAAMAAAGKEPPAVIPLTRIDLADRGRAAATLQALAAVGATGIEHTERYDSLAGFQHAADALLEARAHAGL
jgi:probable F420-dependent oxidoreductase